MSAEASRRRAPRVELAPGYSIAPVITGCWQLAADHGASSLESGDLFRRWQTGLEAGYTTFDCADIYTGVEELLGRFLASIEAPERVQIHTKYVPNRSDLGTLDRRAVVLAVETSLKRLGREALDLVQFHWWDYAVPGAVEAACWLEELRQAGKIRHVGLTNFDLDHVRRIVDAGVQVTSVQVQYSVLDRRPADEFAPWCATRGIALLTYGVLAGGFLTPAFFGATAPSAALGNRSLAKYRLIVEEFGGWEALQRALFALNQVAVRQSVPLPVAAIRWVLDRPGVAAAIVGASRRDRTADHDLLWARDWAAEEWAELAALLANHPGPAGAVYGLERAPDGPHVKILRMDLNDG